MVATAAEKRPEAIRLQIKNDEVKNESANYRPTRGSEYEGPLARMSKSLQGSEKCLWGHEQKMVRKWKGILDDRGDQGFHL